MLGHSKETEDSVLFDEGERIYREHENHMWAFRDRSVKLGMELPDEPSEHQMELLERIRAAAGQTC